MSLGALWLMGNALCRPIIQGHTVPVCSLCEKVADKPWRSIPANEKRLWLIHEGQFFCTKCLISHRIERLQEDKAKEYNQSLTAAITQRYCKAPRTWTPLKKVSSGKAWHNTSSFKAPYVPSPAVEEAMSRVENKTSCSSANVAAENALCTPAAGPVSEKLNEAYEKIDEYVVAASGKLIGVEQTAERGELRAGIMPSVDELDGSPVAASDAGDNGPGDDQDFEALAAAIACCRTAGKMPGKLSTEELVIEGVAEVESVELSDGSRTSSSFELDGALGVRVYAG